MKKIAFIIFTIAFSFNLFGFHKNHVVQKNYGNVKTFVLTPFKNYGSTINVEIIGQLAQELSSRLKYKDTIILEFKHDYSNSYPNITIVEKSNPSSLFLLNGNLGTLKKRQRKYYRPRKEKTAICIRQMAQDFNIWDTLKLLEFSINNTFKNELNTVHSTKFFEYTRDGSFEIEFFGMGPELINSVKTTSTSSQLKALLQEKIEFFNSLNIKGVFYNNQYCFNSNTLDYKTDFIKYLTPLEKGICIFNSDTSFIYLNDKIENITPHKIDAKDHYSFYADKFNYFKKEKVKKGIMLYKAASSYWVIFSEEKNEIIETSKN
nr:hypothetical protein [uncultured Psychroserpens sp.]